MSKFIATAREEIKNKIAGISPFQWTMVLTALMIPSYIWMRQTLISQATSYRAIISDFNINMVILLGLWGWWAEKLEKRKKWSKRKGWIVWGVGMVVLMTVLRLGGSATIFG